MTEFKYQFREDIQGLRAIAVLMVLLFHIDNRILPGGFIGVDVFFVISGFLISSIIARKKANNSFSFIDFYNSRIKRIVPAYYFVLLFITIAGAIFYIKSDVPKLLIGLKYAATFSSNQYFSSIDTYFGAAMSENPLLHTWTLAVEMQFYFFLPFIIYFFPNRSAIVIFSVLFVTLLAYVQYNISLGNKHMMYFSLLARAPEFLAGGVIALTKVKIAKQSFFGGLGLLLIVGSAFLINEDSLFPGLLSLVPCLGAALLITSPEGVINKTILSSKPAVYIGELSYSIYLWHWPILAFVRYYTLQYTLNVITILISLVLICLLSVFSYRFIEGYFRNISNGRLWFGLGLGTLFAVLVFNLIKPINNKIYTYPEYYTTPHFLGMDTHANSYKRDVIRGAKNSKDTMLLLGDSYGLVMGAYLEVLGKKNSFAFRSVTNDSYPTIPGLAGAIPFNRKRTYENLISKARPFYSTRVIFFAKRWDYYIPSFEKAFKEFVYGLSKDQHLVVFSDFPSLDKNPIRRLRGIVKNEHVVAFEKTTPKIPHFIYQLAEKYPNIHILELSDNSVFQDAPFYRDTIMYYDAHHLNRYGANNYAMSTQQEFVELLNRIEHDIK